MNTTATPLQFPQMRMTVTWVLETKSMCDLMGYLIAAEFGVVYSHYFYPVRITRQISWAICWATN
jgi:hypothetical protein